MAIGNKPVDRVIIVAPHSRVSTGNHNYQPNLFQTVNLLEGHTLDMRPDDVSQYCSTGRAYSSAGVVVTANTSLVPFLLLLLLLLQVIRICEVDGV
jgi:hypothetical protein